jgi:putative PIN family toxin of toxin-antitoxin system
LIVAHLVVDTNVVLDLFVFSDRHAHSVHDASLSPSWTWIASASMRDELERVLTYAHIAARMRSCGTSSAQVMALYDSRVQQVAAAPRCSAICKDPDDQKFIDLAVQHNAVLLSKDRAVLALNKRLAVLGVPVMNTQTFVA